MLSEQELEKVLDLIQQRFDEVNTVFIRKIAEQIKQIGKLGQSNINRLVIMAEMTSSVSEITRMLTVATNLTKKDISAIYQVAMRDTYTDPRFVRLFQAQGSEDVPSQTKARLVQYANAVSTQTAQAVDNLSNTTAVQQQYRDATDQAVLAVSSGLMGYQEATRAAVRSLGYNGMQVRYASGYHRRLDTALRQNIIDGANQIAQQGAKIMGEVLEYDAVEISAHAHPAPDHAPVQGRVFLKAEYDKMQSGVSFVDIDGNVYEGFKRPIAEWNCMHIAVPFSTEHSRRRYPNQQLQTWIDDNNAGCDIDGKHYTTYEASQLMRKLETEVRRWKDTAVAAQIVGDDELRRSCQAQINALSAKYGQVSKLSGLPTKRQRMTVEGFKPIK